MRGSKTLRAAVGTLIGAHFGVALVLDSTASTWFSISCLVRVLIGAAIGHGIGHGPKATPPLLTPALEEAARARFTPAMMDP